jgi:hypothetical protein
MTKPPDLRACNLICGKILVCGNHPREVRDRQSCPPCLSRSSAKGRTPRELYTTVLPRALGNFPAPSTVPVRYDEAVCVWEEGRR